MKKFTKMHGLGNDYVYMDAIHQKIDNESELARFVSNRHFGIGSDGLILICKSDIADFKMRMFNQDGSEAEMCGNGIRCVGKFVYDKGLTNKTTVTIETLAGIKTLKFNLKDKKVETVRVDMGEPILNPEKIPVISSENPVKDLKLKALDKEFIFTCVSMGNPHAITLIKLSPNNSLISSLISSTESPLTTTIVLVSEITFKDSVNTLIYKGTPSMSEYCLRLP